MNSLTPQLDTVLALAERLQTFVAVREQMKGTDPEIITVSDGVPLTMSDLREAINAIRAAVGGEAVADPAMYVSARQLDGVETAFDGRVGRSVKASRQHTMNRRVPLYASHPATVDVGALRNIVDDRLIELATRLTKEGPKASHVSCSETHEIADAIFELAALIGEKA